MEKEHFRQDFVNIVIFLWTVLHIVLYLQGQTSDQPQQTCTLQVNGCYWREEWAKSAKVLTLEYKDSLCKKKSKKDILQKNSITIILLGYLNWGENDGWSDGGMSNKVEDLIIPPSSEVSMEGWMACHYSLCPSLTPLFISPSSLECRRSNYMEIVVLPPPPDITDSRIFLAFSSFSSEWVADEKCLIVISPPKHLKEKEEKWTVALPAFIL